MKTQTQSPLSAFVTITDDSIEATIQDRRADAVAVFAPLNDAQRISLATDAWSIGLRALTNAYKQADESRLSDIGKTLKDDLDKQLESYVERQQSGFVQSLAKYFDPRDGQVIGRLEMFLRDEGELATTMNRFLAPETGVIAQTLARELGEKSLLLRRLSPTDSEGVLFMLESKIREALASNQTELAHALDPLAEDGAVARFLDALRTQLEDADNNRSKQLALATKALDANDETSLLSRLMRETTAARTAFVSSMNPDLPNSPMAMMKSALTSLLQQHTKSQQETMTLFADRQAKLEKDIRESLIRLEERKLANAKSTRGGFDFEQIVLRFVQQAVQSAPIHVDTTGNTVGSKANCKVGDQVLRFTGESIYAGGAAVVEAKRDSSYTVSRALQELELARGNRAASSGLFVMAKSHASPSFPNFARYGTDIIVVWDENDESTDPYLHAAVTLALALATPGRRKEDSGEIDALSDIEHRVQKELDRLEKMRKLSESIRNDADKLSEEVRKGGDALGVLLKKAKSTLKALNVELAADGAEKNSPVLLPSTSLADARAVIANTNGADPKQLESA